MKLPSDAIIAAEKLTHYLLIQRDRNDKSRWLAQAGYTLENWQTLAHDLRAQLLAKDATPIELTEYGQLYEITGTLTGPIGRELAVRSIWMTEIATGFTKFITLYPNRRS